MPTENHRDVERAEQDESAERWSLAPDQREALRAMLGAVDDADLQRTARILSEVVRAAADEIVKIGEAIRAAADAARSLEKSVRADARLLQDGVLQEANRKALRAVTAVEEPSIVLRASSPQEAFFDGLGDLLCLMPEPEPLGGLRIDRRRPSVRARPGRELARRKKSEDRENNLG